ncbi:MAG: hypothetical protein PHT40_00205 [Patescibacteria group bacterium]|nr:hypothetical protein [Patescibacteria group bacterium]
MEDLALVTKTYGLLWLAMTWLRDKNDEEKLVKIGDVVEIRPSPHERHIDFLKKSLGKGPYTISRIVKWPCGKIKFYLKTEKGETRFEDMPDASDFICCE